MRRIVFDLDGTLLDTLPDIHGVADAVLADEGHPPLAREAVRGFIGRGVPVFVERMIAHAGLDPADHARLTRAFLDRYGAATGQTRPFPGVLDALDRLAAEGLALSICTNKPEGPTRTLLSVMGWEARFDLVIGGDTLPTRKPDPAPLFAALGETPQGEVLYVGDSETDAETAVAAGLPFALFTGGYRKTPVAEIPHAHAFDHFDALPGIALRA